MSGVPHRRTSRPLGTLLVLVFALSALSPCAACDHPAAGAPPEGRALVPWWDYNWNYRASVTIDNTKLQSPLSDYPVLVNISAPELVSAGKLRSDGGDARFADSDGKTQLGYYRGSESDFWVKVQNIPAGSKKTIYFYYGNPSATSKSDLNVTYIFREDFEGGSLDSSKWEVADGSWTIISDGGSRVLQGTGAGGSSWARRTIRLKLPNDETVKDLAVEMDWRVSEDNTLANFIYRAQTTSIASSDRWWGRIESRSSYGKGFNLLKSVSGGETHIGNRVPVNPVTTYNHYHIKASDTTHTLAVRGILSSDYTDGSVNQAGYLGLQVELNSLYIDNILIRKYFSPEPSSKLGAEEYPFKFLSAEVSSQAPNEGEEVLVNVTFNNPTSNPISFEVALHEGAERADASVVEKRPVTLGPDGDKLVQFAWTAEGGNTVLWVELDGSPLASFPMTVNWLPVLDYIPDQRFVQDQAVTLRFTARDKDGEALSWSEDCPLFNFTRTNATGAEAAFRPTNDDVGAYVV
ncbi:MAG: DUF2341 domain-containing protein, partial [Euryarchaeota archaeon]|nr:DUF2341 domain-containing protein [Euryarchaeota archaeon]